MEGRKRPRLNQVPFHCDWEDCRRLALGYYPARLAVRQKLSPYRFCRPAHQQRHWRQRQREKRLATMTPRLCPLCGKAIPPELRPGRPRRYCSPEHQASAANRRRPSPLSGAVLEEAVRKADLAAQEAWAVAEAAAETAMAASQEAAAAEKSALSRYIGKDRVDGALALVDKMKDARRQLIAANREGREADVMRLSDLARQLREELTANPLAALIYESFLADLRREGAQHTAQESTEAAQAAREVLADDVLRREKRAAAARLRRAKVPTPLPQNAAGKLVYPSWHTRAGQEIEIE